MPEDVRRVRVEAHRNQRARRPIQTASQSLWPVYAGRCRPRPVSAEPAGNQGFCEAATGEDHAASLFNPSHKVAEILDTPLTAVGFALRRCNIDNAAVLPDRNVLRSGNARETPVGWPMPGV